MVSDIIEDLREAYSGRVVQVEMSLLQGLAMIALGI
jgi:hypothetical protein